MPDQEILLMVVRAAVYLAEVGWTYGQCVPVGGVW